MTWRPVSLFIGLLLASAAFSKLSDPRSRELMTYLIVGFELFWAWLLWIDFRPNLLRRSTAALFLCLAVIALFKAVRGDSSCGCFGKIELNPWWTLILDAGVSFCAATAPLGPEPTKRGWPVKVLLATGMLCIAALVFLATRPAIVTGPGVIASGKRIVLLEPEQWVGQMFPLTNQIDVGAKLLNGEWMIVLFRNDCSACAKAMPSHVAAAARGEQTALVELPPFAAPENSIVPPESKCLYGRMSRRRLWIVKTPLELRLSNGKVVGFDSRE